MKGADDEVGWVRIVVLGTLEGLVRNVCNCERLSDELQAGKIADERRSTFDDENKKFIELDPKSISEFTMMDFIEAVEELNSSFVLDNDAELSTGGVVECSGDTLYDFDDVCDGVGSCEVEYESD